MQLQSYEFTLIHNSANGDVMVIDSCLLLERYACLTNMQPSLMYWMLINNLSCICMGAGIIFLLC